MAGNGKVQDCAAQGCRNVLLSASGTGATSELWSQNRNEKDLLSMILTALIGSSTTFAHDGSSAASKHSDKPTVQAPVRRRQPPRAGDEPNETNLSDPNNPLSKEDAALDRKIGASATAAIQDVQAGASDNMRCTRRLSQRVQCRYGRNPCSHP